MHENCLFSNQTKIDKENNIKRDEVLLISKIGGERGNENIFTHHREENTYKSKGWWRKPDARK